MDLNGDGLPDLLSANWGASGCAGPSIVVQFAQPGTLQYGPPTCVDAGSVMSDWNTLTINKPLDTTYVFQADIDLNYTLADLIDLTGDGLPDFVIVTSQGWHCFPLYQRNGQWVFGPMRGLPTPPSAPDNALRVDSGTATSAKLVDLNGDGLPDYVFADATGKWTVDYNVFDVLSLAHWFNPVAGASAWSATASVEASSVVLQDMNGDGRADLVTRNSSGGFGLAVNTGNGFAPTRLFSAPANPSCIRCNTAPSDYLPYSVTTIAYSDATPPNIPHPIGFDGSNGAFLDVDGDGVPDYVVWDNGNWFYYPGLSPAAPDLMTSLDLPSGVTVTVTFGTSNAYVSMTTNRPIVTSVTTTGAALPGGQLTFNYDGPFASASWDDPTRVEQFGYLHSSVTAGPPNRTTTTTWGQSHLLAGLVLSVDTNLSAFDDSVVLIYGVSALGGLCVDAAAAATSPSTFYPALRFTNRATRSHTEGATSFSSMTFVGGPALPSAVPCTSVDLAGNVLVSTVVPDTSQGSPAAYVDSVTTTTAYPDPANSSALCKTCALSTVSKTSSGTVLRAAQYWYDAPAGAFAPAGAPANSSFNLVSQSVVTKGHLNFELALVSGTTIGGVGEVGSKISYDSYGRVAQLRRDYSQQCISIQLTTFDYDAFGQRVLLETIADDSGAPPIRKYFGYDPASGRKQWEQANGLKVDYKYDSFGRLLAVTRDADGATLASSAFVSPTLVAGQWSPGSIKSSKWETTSASLDSSTYFDGLGRAIQTRTALSGDASALSAANVAGDGIVAANAYLVSGTAIFDALGRLVAAVDPYYASGQAYASPTGSATEIPAGAHASLRQLDLEGRPTCIAYAQIGAGQPVPAGLSGACTSSSSPYQLSTQLSYSATRLNGQNFLSSSVVDTWRTQQPPARQLRDASGRVVFTIDRAGNLTYSFRDLDNRIAEYRRYQASSTAATYLTEQTTFDLLGRPTRQLDDSSREKDYFYSASGQLIKIAQGTGQTVGVTMLYGRLGQLVQKTEFAPGDTSNSLTYTYDPATGRLASASTWSNSQQ